MKKHSTHKFFFSRSIMLCCMMLCFIFQSRLSAINYVSNVAAGNWNTPATWNPVGTPTNADNVTITAGQVITVNAPGGVCNNLVINGTLSWGGGQTCTANTITMAGGSSATGTANGGILISNTTFTANAGVVTIGRITLTVTTTSTIAGVLTITQSTSGTKTFTGNVTFNNGGGINYNVSETLDMNANVTFNGTVNISGTTAGILNIGGNETVSAGATLNISDVDYTVTGTSQIDGAIAFGNNNGTKQFGSITVSGSGNWNAGATDEMFILTQDMTVNGTFSGQNTATGNNEYRFNSATAAFNGTATISNIYCPAGTILTNNGTLTCNDSLYGGGTYMQGAGSTLKWTSTLKVRVTTFNASANGNIVNYNFAGYQTIRGVTYYDLKSSQSGTKLLGANTTVSNDLTIQGTSQIDADASSNRSLTVGGNWTVTSTNADPFVEELGLVTFNGSSGTQAITTVLAAGESFYTLTINNTSATSPGLTVNKNIAVGDQYTHTAGILDLVGHNLTITGNGTATTDNYTAGSIITSVAGSTITVTDPSNNKTEHFYGTSIGNATFGITTTVTSNDSYFTGTHLYGTASFTKTGSGNNDTQGGNVFYGPVSFTTTAAADRWRMANAQPDTFYNATFTHNGASNFIVSRQTMGNAFYGTTTFTSSTSGGMYVSRGNTASNASSTFFGPVIVNITLSGFMMFSEGSATINNSTTFASTITLNSTASSTGDISFGSTNNNNSTTLLAGASFAAGSISGQTNLYIRNLTQLGATTQTINTAGSTGILYVGGATSVANSYANTFNGTVNMTADTAGYVVLSTFNGPTTFTVANGNGYILTNTTASTFTASVFNIRYTNNIFGGTTSLTHTGTTNSTANGGNTYNGAATIRCTGTGQLRNASSATDDFNGNATFIQTNTGTLSPAYSNDITLAGNISTVGSTAVITFGTTGSATAITDGAGAQTVDGPAGFIPIFVRLTTNHTGTVQMNKNFSVTTTLTMTQGIVNLNGTTLTLGTAVGSPGTLNYTNGWFYGGTFKRWMTTPILAVGNVAGLFPMGSDAAQNDYHPFWFAHSAALTTGGTVSVIHTPTLPGTNSQIFNDASWGNGVQAVSISIWTVSTANGLALSGANGIIRFGGTGFTPFTLTDLDACLAASAIATFGAATSVNVPLEVNRTGLTTAQLANAWHIGTKWQTNSPLPIELISFTATPSANDVLLHWSTATETNNAFFTVERSVDGNAFEAIGQVNGAGNSTSEIEYNLLDDHALKGVSYYRLKQTDFNGQSTYSEIAAVDLENDELIFSLYPNPANSGDAGLSVNVPANTDLTVTVFDVQGKLIYSATENSGDANTVRFDLAKAGLSTGIYMVNVSTGFSTKSCKLVVR